MNALFVKVRVSILTQELPVQLVGEKVLLLLEGQRKNVLIAVAQVIGKMGIFLAVFVEAQGLCLKKKGVSLWVI